MRNQLVYKIKRSAAAEMDDRLATIDMGRKEKGCCAPFGRGELGPHPVQCAIDRGLSLYQVAS